MNYCHFCEEERSMTGDLICLTCFQDNTPDDNFIEILQEELNDLFQSNDDDLPY